MTGPVAYFEEEAFWRTLLRWSLAGLCVVGLYAGLIYAVLNWPREAMAASDAPAAIMIDMAPAPVAPDTPQQDVALGPQMEISQAATPSEQQDKPVEEREPEAEVRPETKTEVDVPPLPEMEKPAAVLMQATPPEPQREKPKEEKPKPDKPKKAKKKPQDRAAKNAPATTAPQSVDAPRAATNAASMAGMSSSASTATWRSMIMALLNRNKRLPPSGGRGTATVAFTVDRSGRVLSARLARSSGDTALDQEAVALARRVSPVPAPPADVGHGGSVLLAVPVRFGE